MGRRSRFRFRLASAGAPMGAEQITAATAATVDASAGETQRRSRADRVRERTIREPGPRTCKRYMRARLAQALPEIATRLIEASREGSLPELKMLLQMCGLDDKDALPDSKRRRGRSLAEQLLDEWRREPLDGGMGTNGATGGTGAVPDEDDVWPAGFFDAGDAGDGSGVSGGGRASKPTSF